MNFQLVHAPAPAAWCHHFFHVLQATTSHPTCRLMSFPNKTSERSSCPFDFSQELRHLEINGAAQVG
jgi:hypothetical protein